MIHRRVFDLSRIQRGGARYGRECRTRGCLPRQNESDHRRVVATWGPEVSDAALMAYQKSVWGDPVVAGFDEVIDFRALEGIDVISEGLSRVCEAFREMDAASSRPITIFYRPENAFNWRDDRPAP